MSLRVQQALSKKWLVFQVSLQYLPDAYGSAQVCGAFSLYFSLSVTLLLGGFRYAGFWFRSLIFTAMAPQNLPPNHDHAERSPPKIMIMLQNLPQNHHHGAKSPSPHLVQLQVGGTALYLSPSVATTQIGCGGVGIVLDLSQVRKVKLVPPPQKKKNTA